MHTPNLHNIISNEELIGTVKSFLSTCGFFTDIMWHVDDVHDICRKHDLPPLTNDEAKRVFNLYGELFGGDAGMDYKKLERAVLIYCQERKLLMDTY